MWSYKIIKNYYTTEDELNEYGSDGWELVTVSYHRLYFKKWVEPETFWAVTLVETTEVDSAPFNHGHSTGPTGMYTVDAVTGYTGHTGPIIEPMTGDEVIVDVAPQPEVI